MTERQLRYKALKQSAPLLVRCAACGVLGPRQHMDPHHVNGRHGDNLYSFVWLHRHCHTVIHDKPREARSLGLLTYTNQKEIAYHGPVRTSQESSIDPHPHIEVQSEPSEAWSDALPVP